MTVSINLKVFLFGILFYITKQIKIYALLMIFALIHEMGHLLCGILLGFKPKKLKIMPLGISIEFNVINEDYNKKIKQANIFALKKMLIALAGPITNIVIILICLLMKRYLQEGIYSQIIYANILIAIFNMIPIYPLDGGRVLKYLVHIFKGNEESVEIVNIISNACVIFITMISSIGIYSYKNIAILLIVIYLWILVIMENKKYHIKKRIYKIMQNNLK